jgi:hypothetical protein
LHQCLLDQPARRHLSHEAKELDFQVLHNDLPAQRSIFWKVRVKAHSLAEFGPYIRTPANSSCSSNGS